MKEKPLHPNAEELISDAFAKAEPWAGELSGLLRELIHKAVPGVQEDWKWGPNFNYKGMLVGVWPFRKHVSLVFFKGAAMTDEHGMLIEGEGKNVRNRMMKFYQGGEVDFKLVEAYLKKAAKLNDEGVKLPARREPPAMPEYIRQWLEASGMLDKFEGFSPSHKREIIEYITEAKREETKVRRMTKVKGDMKK